jgi:hypothetical protein
LQDEFTITASLDVPPPAGSVRPTLSLSRKVR